MRGTVPTEVSFLFAYRNQKDLGIVWHYFEAHHGKCPKDDIKDTIKNMVFVKVLSSSNVINTFKEFAEFARTWSRQRVYTYTQYHKIHTILRSCNSKGEPCNKFFHLSNNEEPHFVQWYDFACGHNENEVDDITSFHCLND